VAFLAPENYRKPLVDRTLALSFFSHPLKLEIGDSIIGRLYQEVHRLTPRRIKLEQRSTSRIQTVP
jgi:hypothetical protein